jgi:GTP-binding protein LepA
MPNDIKPGFTPQKLIRNFSIIAHIDHGKSTLADRMLQITGIVDERLMRAQYLDRMDIERERGITIKSQSVRMPWKLESDIDGYNKGDEFILNMIDTPGHVDFSYEVSRSLAASDGAILLVDAAQGIEAQTLANLYIALENNLEIIPVLNKIDLPSAEPEKYAAELCELIGCDPEDILKVSGKTGAGVKELLDTIVKRVPCPDGNEESSALSRAMIFDSVYDIYRGVITYIRMIDGTLTSGEKIKMMSNGASHELLEIGVISPEPIKCKTLKAGEVGYLITGVKDVSLSKVGDTVTNLVHPSTDALPGYADPKPMVFAGLFPVDGDQYSDFREALDKLKLNDASLIYEPETSAALGFGFRIGFLGILHLEIILERIDREFGIALISTMPNVSYIVTPETGETVTVTNPSEYPEGKILDVKEPVVKTTIITPSEYIGAVMKLCQDRRGEQTNMNYLSKDRVEINYRIPLSEVVFDFFNALKSATKGYASLDYEIDGVASANLVKVDILLQGDRVDAFSQIVHRDRAYAFGSKMAAKLKELIPRQQFEIPIQAAIGGSIIARENIKALRKDVTAKCYGGDISRKRKLLEKQKAGKKRMKMIGRVEVPPEAFVAALKTGDTE